MQVEPTLIGRKQVVPNRGIGLILVVTGWIDRCLYSKE
jgi:hypothetical protein